MLIYGSNSVAVLIGIDRYGLKEEILCDDIQILRSHSSGAGVLVEYWYQFLKGGNSGSYYVLTSENKMAKWVNVRTCISQCLMLKKLNNSKDWMLSYTPANQVLGVI